MLPQGASASDTVILVIGDSLSAGYGIDPDEGWVALLVERLREQAYGHHVVNASISGDTTRGGLARLPRALDVHQPDVVIIELGGNDGLRGQPVGSMRRNLTAMIEASREAGARVLLAGIRIPENYGRTYADSFRGVYTDLAEHLNVALVPFLLEDVALDPDLMQADGVHPNARAQPLLLNTVWKHLEPILAAAAPATAPAAP